jgi:hypothetical protein
MSEVGSSPAAPEQPAEWTNVFQRYVGVLFAPAETFQSIARRPNVLMPLIVVLVISLVSTAVVIPRMDFEALTAEQAQTMRKQNPNMSESDIERMERITTASAKVFGWISPVFMLLWYLLVAGALLLGVRLMGGEGDFKQAFSATLYAWAPLILFGIISAIVVLARGSFDPTTAAGMVKSNLGFLADNKDQPVLYSLLSAFDVFTIWTIVLLVFGFSALSKLSRGKTAAIIVTLWFVMLAIRLGFAALGAARMNA